MAEAQETLGVASAPTADFFPLDDLPNDVLVSVFAAVGDPTWVRHTFPLVCRAWNELYLTKDASPLHETLEVNFYKEVRAAAREGEGRRDTLCFPRRPVVHASRVIEWAQGRAGDVRKLRLRGEYLESPEDITAEDLGALVAVVAPSLTDFSIGPDLAELCKRPLWESLRDHVVPAGRLRSFDIYDSLGSDLEPLLGQLAGSLEELVLTTFSASPLSRFPESLCALKKLRRLVLTGHFRITAIPAEISSLKKLEELDLRCCGLSSLPKELGELSALTKLVLSSNYNLGTLPADEAFPAALGKMKSLRDLNLYDCGLRSVPSFVCELKSLEILVLRNNDLSSTPKELGELSGLTQLVLYGNKNLGTALPTAEAFPAELGKMKSLRFLSLDYCGLRTVPAFVGELKSLRELDLPGNDLSSLPKELGELLRLTKLDLTGNENLGTTLPAEEAFPAELGKMKSLRELDLSQCGLRTVPAFVGEQKSLRVLNLYGCGLRTVPAFVFELKSLESLNLAGCYLSSLPKELGELSGLTKLDLRYNEKIGTALPADEAFPAELRKMKSLRELNLMTCGLRTVPAFLGKLESLEVLHLRNGNLQIDAPLDFLIEGCPRLREVDLKKPSAFYGPVPWTPQSLAHLEAFKAKLRARNPKAKVF